MRLKNFKKKINIKYFIFSILILFFMILPLFSDTNYKVHLVLNGALFIGIIFFLYHKKRKYLFEPMYIFSLYYLTVPIVIWYYIITNFENNKFIQATTFQHDFNVLFLISVFYFAIGFLLTVLGHKKCSKDDLKCEIVLEAKEKISDFSCIIISSICIGMGIFNFLYNVFYYANGNVLYYLFSMANRYNEFANGGTTLGYTIASIGLFVLMFKTLRDETKKSYLIFFISFLCVFIMKLSTGRIFNTISFVGTVVAVYYFFSISKTGKLNNKIFVSCGCGLLVLGIVFYFIRILGGLDAAGQLNTSIGSYFSQFIEQFGYYAIDKGNMPNIVLLPKIIDAWGTDIGYLYGSSLFTWVFSFLPSSFVPTLAFPAVLVKEAWFANVTSGNLPVTIIGEFYANFGWIGPIVGMFIFGYLITKLFDFTLKKKNYWLFVITMQITIGFIALSPKGEVNNFSLWMVVPYIVCYLLLIVVTRFENKYLLKICRYFKK